MYFELSDLFWLTFFALIIWAWWGSQKVKEIALAAAKRRCQSLELQFLDGSVAVRRIWFKRDDNGKLRLWRLYTFEFSSTGDERYHGHVITLGNRITKLHTDPHRIVNEE